MLNDAGLIEIVESSNILTEDIWAQIDQEIDKDIDIFAAIYPQEELNDHMLFNIGEYQYCYPMMRYIYASLYISEKTNSQCMFDHEAIVLCNSKFGISRQNSGLKARMEVQGITDVFNAIMPDDIWAPAYLVAGECSSCKHMKEKCYDKFLSETEQSIKTYMNWREYDEIIQIKEVLNKIIKRKKDSDGLLSPLDIKREFDDVKQRYANRLHKRFPKMRRWSRFITYLSFPVGFISLLSGNITAGLISNAVGIANSLSSNIIADFQEKHNWINFTLKEGRIKE